MASATTKATRDGFGRALEELGENYDFYVLDADLSNSTRTEYFMKKFPERFIDCGISEANMIGVAAGIASTGIPAFTASYAIFITRAFEQIRNSVAYPNLNVKIAGSHAGISVGADGATHQCCEDIALMRSLPNMTVLSTCDVNETRQAVEAVLNHKGPVYMRLSRYPAVDVFGPDYRFELGKGVVLREGSDAAIFATGIVVGEAVEAHEILKQAGINAAIINISTIKPIDRPLVEQYLGCKNIFSVEEHSVIGGLGGAIAEIISENPQAQAKLTRIGLPDCFGMSGDAAELMEHFGLNAKGIANTVMQALNK